MNAQGTLYLVRGLPGSGRTTAIERVRGAIPGLVFVDADPPGQAEEYCDPKNQRMALLRAAEDIRALVEHGTENIAVETAAPRGEDVGLLLHHARKAGYAIEEIQPAGMSPKDVIYCFEHSSHLPNPEYLAEIVSAWEDVDVHPEQKRAPLDRKAAWKHFTAAMAADSHEMSERAMNEIYRKFPTEAALLQLETGPTWGRFQPSQAPSFPLASISPFWAEVKAAALGTAEMVVGPLRPIPMPQGHKLGPSLT